MTDTASGTDWSRLLDRLEQRLRLIDATVRPQQPGQLEIGPPPEDADLPAAPPTPQERIRLLALLAEHDRLIARMEGQRRSLRQAQYYQMAGG